MILGVDKGTKLLTQLIGLDKSYQATIDFSLSTDTWDQDFREKKEEFPLRKEGEKTGIKKADSLIPAPSQEELQSSLESILYQEDKETLLPLPPFSAKKKAGQRSYAAARKGNCEIEEKAMKIYGYQILDYQFPELKLEVMVGSGTYIRSIAYRLGQQHKLGGALTQLQRISTGNYQLDQIGQKQLAKGNIKGAERTIFFQETSLEEILEKNHTK